MIGPNVAIIVIITYVKVEITTIMAFVSKWQISDVFSDCQLTTWQKSLTNTIDVDAF